MQRKIRTDDDFKLEADAVPITFLNRLEEPVTLNARNIKNVRYYKDKSVPQVQMLYRYPDIPSEIPGEKYVRSDEQYVVRGTVQSVRMQIEQALKKPSSSYLSFYAQRAPHLELEAF